MKKKQIRFSLINILYVAWWITFIMWLIAAVIKLLIELN